MSPRTTGGGNGCLYGLLGLGVLMVVAGLGLSVLPDLDRILPDRSPPPRQITDEWPPEPEVDPLAEPALDPEAVPRSDDVQGLIDDLEADPQVQPDEGVRPTLLWHAQSWETPPVACVLAIDASERPGGAYSAAAVRLHCADGRMFSGAGFSVALTAMRTGRGVAFRAQTPNLVAGATRGSWAELSFDTQRHELYARAAQAAPLALFIEELSVPHPTLPPLGPRTPVGVRIARLAVPTLVSGDLPAAVAMVRGTGPSPRRGDPVCELTVAPTFASSFTCRVLLRCGGQTIYGAGTSGLNDCGLEQGVPSTANDDGTTPENGDPRIRFDINANTLVVSDSTERGTWSASFELLPDPRCGHGAYVGAARQTPNNSAFSLGPFADTPSYQIAGAATLLTAVNPYCGSEELEVQDNAQRRSWLSFGPGASSIAGYLGSPLRAVWGFRR